MITSDKVELEILSEVSKVANSTLEYSIKLESIVRVIAGKLGRDVCYVVLRDKDRDTLVLKAAVGLEPESIDRVMLRMGEGVVGWAAEHKQPVALAVARNDPRFRLVTQTGEDRYTSLLAVPILYDERCIGVLAIQTVEPHEYSADEITLVSTIANDVGGIINSAQLYQDAKTNLEALSALYEVSQALMSTLELPTLLDRIARSSAEVIGAKGCILRLLNKGSGMLEIKASYGFADDLGRKTELRLGESIAGRVAAEGKPMLIKDVYEDPDFLNATGAIIRSLLCVPMIAKDKVIGTIALYDKEETGKHGEQPFTDEDLHLLTTLAAQASMAVENAFIYERAEDLAQENEKKAAELSFLYDVAYAMRSTLKLDRLLHTVLTAMTIGGGLSFNRAVLFLVNERTKTMQGMLGVGPSSAWEAGEIWARLGDLPVNFRDWTLTDAELAAQNESSFNRMAKSLRISYEDETGVFAVAIRERRAILIEDAETDPLAGPEVLELMAVRSFAVVPLVAKDKVTSLVVVDNKFSGRPINQEGLRFMMMFANQAGLAIEAAMAYSNVERANRDLNEAQARLIQSEKMAALGEMAASIAHEIKNPLTVIGGFAARLAKKATEGDEARYARIIRDEALRLDKILQEVLDFSRDMRPKLGRSSLNALCEETLDMYAEQLREKGIKARLDLSPELCDVMIDAQQMKQAVINILSNSMQAMEASGGRELNIRTFKDADAGRMVLEVEDTGGGIPADIMENIFNPFFTTKEKGTGLGLAITNKIVKTHGGEIEVVNREGVGAVFRIKLRPVHAECAGLTDETNGEE